MIRRPCASSAVARASISNAVSVPSRSRLRASIVRTILTTMHRLVAVLALSAGCLVLATGVSGGPGATYADVAPILNSKCVGCHTIGGIAPFSLASAADAHAH